MKRDSFADLDVVVGGGTDGNGGGDGPLLVLLHGFGAGGEDLVPLAYHMKLPSGSRFVCPAGPLSLGMPFSDARAWWMIDLARIERVGRDEWSRETPEGLVSSRQKVLACLDVCWEKLDAKPEKTVIGGFSQGAMLSTDVALHSDKPLAGLLTMSGAIVAEADWTARMPARKGFRVFQSHGTHDPLLPYAIATRLRMMWESAGADVDFVSFAGGHEIPPEVISGAEALVAAVLG